MAKTDIWMPWYITDYMRDTGEMTVEEDCFYRRALDQCWLRRGGIPKEPARLCSLLRLTPTQFKRCKWILDRFFYAGEEGYRNTRLDNLLWEAANLKSAAANGARKTNERRWGKKSPSVSPSDTVGESQGVSLYGRTSPSPSPSPLSGEKTHGAPWPIFRATVEALFGKPTSQATEQKAFRLVGELSALGATPDELEKRTKHYRLCWPDVTCTLQAVLNNWAIIPTLKPKEKSNGTHRTNRSESLDAGASEFLNRIREAQRPDRGPNPEDGDFHAYPDSGT